MKKLVVLTAAIALFGCSKQAEQELMQTSNERVELSTSGVIEVGVVDAQGNATITHNMADLAEYAACAVSEDDAFNLHLEYVAGAGYYLNGFGSSTGSHTTFAIELEDNSGELSWVESSTVLTCETTASTPCDLEVQSAQTYTCDNDNGSCGQTIIDGLSDVSCAADHEFPWMITKRGKK